MKKLTTTTATKITTTTTKVNVICLCFFFASTIVCLSFRKLFLVLGHCRTTCLVCVATHDYIHSICCCSECIRDENASYRTFFMYASLLFFFSFSCHYVHSLHGRTHLRAKLKASSLFFYISFIVNLLSLKLVRRKCCVHNKNGKFIAKSLKIFRFPSFLLCVLCIFFFFIFFLFLDFFVLTFIRNLFLLMNLGWKVTSLLIIINYFELTHSLIFFIIIIIFHVDKKNC